MFRKTKVCLTVLTALAIGFFVTVTSADAAGKTKVGKSGGANNSGPSGNSGNAGNKGNLGNAGNAAKKGNHPNQMRNHSDIDKRGSGSQMRSK